MLARRVRVPYTVALVGAGIVVAVWGVEREVALSKDLIFKAFLPPLIFEAAFQIPWPQVRKDLPLTLTMATVGVLLAAGVTAGGMMLFVGWAWLPAALFAILLSATDPVSVIATLKELKIEGRLRILMETESLFNDGTVAATFSVLLAVFLGASDATRIGASFLWVSVGGLASGILVGYAAQLLAGRSTDHLVEITFSTIVAYGSFLIAEHFGCSGVLATVSAGLVFGQFGKPERITDRGREAVLSFWEYMAFVANSLIFLLLGIQLAEQDFGAEWKVSLLAIGLVLAGRAAAVYGTSVFFLKSRVKVTTACQHALFWGGLRGALALALALGLPLDFPHRSTILTASFAVVAFSVIVQGLTISPLLKQAAKEEKEIAALAA